MKKHLKRFLKLSWRGIPIGIIASVLIGTAVLAAIIIPAVTLTITQDIVEPEAEFDFGEITAPPMDLLEVVKTQTFNLPDVGQVTVDLGADGINMWLHSALTVDDSYDSFRVTLICATSPGGTLNGKGFNLTKGGSITRSFQLAGEGLYTFDVSVEGKAGSTTGTATSSVDLTLEDLE